ncbi:P-loop containing nucleoside triphosphate hydrolase protein [Mycena vulgaris]|nr:P-loop containing nucleoside triphosphate hydrolase protein [Mycena vulgaris]
MGTLLEVKHIDKIRLPDSGEWIIQDGSSSVVTPRDTDAKYAEWAEYAFLVRRKVVQTRGSDYPNMTTKLLIRSDRLRKVLREVMKITEGVNWNGSVLKVDPDLLLAFLPQIRVASSSYNTADSLEDEESTTKAYLNLLIEFLESEYASTLQKIGTLVDHGEVTFDLLWAIFVPGEILFALCETTDEPRAFRLKSIQQKRRWPTDTVDWDLTCEYVEAGDDPAAAAQQFGLATHSITIENFDGTRKITDLTTYPIKHHPAADRIRQKIIHRGRKWCSLHGAHHKQYNGLAWRESQRGRLVVRIDGRIMIDRDTFARSEPGYSRPTPRKGLLGLLWDTMEDDEPRRKKSNLSSVNVEDLKEDDLLMATPIVYGFSLTAKKWFEFNVECVTDIEWNDDAFNQLAIDPDRKILIRGLVKSHAGLNEERSVDDFVAGKGGGLIMNLFGPPGVGKTLTVEATSEHLRKPLYIVSAGDLGTDPTSLDKALTEIFSLVPAWDAVVLIDEADVFLEERGTADVERNAMVAVFLRQLEYFQGILFLTTNRVKQFDAAFQSRIHLSLHYTDLSRAEKEKLWRAFWEKARTTRPGAGLLNLSPQQLKMLSSRDLNGRQIKNTVKLAVALAAEETETLAYAHLVRTMGISDDWGSTRTESTPSAPDLPDLPAQPYRHRHNSHLRVEKESRYPPTAPRVRMTAHAASRRENIAGLLAQTTSPAQPQQPDSSLRAGICEHHLHAHKV